MDTLRVCGGAAFLMPMSINKTSIKALEVAERHRQALEYRKQGKGLQWIADKLGYANAMGAYKAIMSALQKTLQEPADELRTLELVRLDALLDATWLWASQGKPQAIDRVLRIMERRAKLLGLDAPQSFNFNFKQEVERISEQEHLDPALVMAEALSILKEGV